MNIQKKRKLQREQRLLWPVTGLQKLVDRGSLLAITIKIWVMTETESTEIKIASFVISILFGLVVLERIGIYKSNRAKSMYKLGRRIVVGWFLSCFIYAAIMHVIVRDSPKLQEQIVFWCISMLIILCLNHIGLRLYSRRRRIKGTDMKEMAYLGSHEGAKRLYGELKEKRWTGIELIAYFGGYENEEQGDEIRGLYKGDLEAMRDWLRQNDVDIIVFSDIGNRETSKEMIKLLGNTCANIWYMPLWFESTMDFERSSIGGINCLDIWGREKDRLELELKRILDLLVAVLILLVSVPVFLIVAIIIKSEDGGPIIFEQERYGLDGRRFKIYKFRTMKVEDSGTELRQATRNDSRVTKIGKVLRRSSLDELPQLINIIKGEMSFVGPRPHASEHNELYREKVRGYMQRHICKPGMTGLAQINGLRGETENYEKMRQRIQKDLDYVREWSLWLDIKIILKTAAALIMHEAY
jgi:putative colanic acid biosynthesis UDP-glucose lipid carrier transferase